MVEAAIYFEDLLIHKRYTTFAGFLLDGIEVSAGKESVMSQGSAVDPASLLVGYLSPSGNHRVVELQKSKLKK